VTAVHIRQVELFQECDLLWESIGQSVANRYGIEVVSAVMMYFDDPVGNSDVVAHTANILAVVVQMCCAHVGSGCIGKDLNGS
jgi:hypothetical protein